MELFWIAVAIVVIGSGFAMFKRDLDKKAAAKLRDEIREFRAKQLESVLETRKEKQTPVVVSENTVAEVKPKAKKAATKKKAVTSATPTANSTSNDTSIDNTTQSIVLASILMSDSADTSPRESSYSSSSDYSSSSSYDSSPSYDSSSYDSSSSSSSSSSFD